MASITLFEVAGKHCLRNLERSMIDAQLRVEDERLLWKAAESLRDDYLNDSELAAFSAIEGDPFHEQR